MNRALYLLPILVLGVIIVFAVRGLAIDPSVQPSALLNEPLPSLALDPVPGRGDALTQDDLRGEPSLLNIYGSWCAPCAVEHPFLMELAAQGVAIYGLDWRDTPEDAAAWLDRRGNPYRKVGIEPTSGAILDLGVTGAPETFLIDANGVIRYRHVGMLTPDAWRRDVEPKYEALLTLSPDEGPIMPGGDPGVD